VLWNQVLAAFRTTRVQHGATTACLHARAEAVCAGVFELAGLESAFHGRFSMSGQGKCGGKDLKA